MSGVVLNRAKAERQATMTYNRIRYIYYKKGGLFFRLLVVAFFL